MNLRSSCKNGGWEGTGFKASAFLRSGSSGRKARATREIFTLMGNMRTKETKTRNRTRKASRHWVVTKLRMTSTSEVHRWMISPVWWAVCQAKGSFWMWE